MPPRPARGTILLGPAMWSSSSYFYRPKGRSLFDYFIERGYLVIDPFADFPLESLKKASFDDLLEHYRKLIKKLPHKNLHFLGHSVGGLIGTLAISKEKKPFCSVTLLCPALWGHTKEKIPWHRFSQKALLYMALYLSKFFGYFPARKLKLGDENGSRAYFEQLILWSKKNSFWHYGDFLRDLPIDINLLEASQDRWMAPSCNIDWLDGQFGGKVKRHKISQKEGFFDAGHFSIIYSKKASRVVWPFIDKIISESKNAGT